jgi:hypothetical protein
MVYTMIEVLSYLVLPIWAGLMVWYAVYSEGEE